MGACNVCRAGEGGEGPGTDAFICPRCVAEVFASEARKRPAWSSEPECTWAPESAPRSRRERLEDLRELGDRSRSSTLPPEPFEELAPPPSLRAAIRGVELFVEPAAPKVAREEEEAEPRSSSRGKKFFALERLLSAALIAGSVLVAYRIGGERAGALDAGVSRAFEGVAGRALVVARGSDLELARSAEAASAEAEKGAGPASPVAVPARASMPARAATGTKPSVTNEIPAQAKADVPAEPEPPKPRAAQPISLAEAMAAAVQEKPAKPSKPAEGAHSSGTNEGP